MIDWTKPIRQTLHHDRRTEYLGPSSEDGSYPFPRAVLFQVGPQPLMDQANFSEDGQSCDNPDYIAVKLENVPE